ncbi:transmembrane protein, putative (macronuclear) [Tetrahymena thermophila SB210]|uniref:Transmembrane protein, putative n=1 Tax=Tetrahymena thermophila (strain SB210) TaxID=312017 RepID=I7M607_TETTS|nr:transmembrane protein, putative [Tetrahymena thermophila SB210]EAR83982.1 transmembrane protein, putative [Tetrahymena thermophila SB210]|eukprot:XP_001031645.1 transmembrane protein, putative [Tetrahymena thermophila SB210]
MNLKLWAIISAIALLGIGTTVLLQKSHKKHIATIEDFKVCVMKNLFDCNQLKDETEKKNCQSADSYLSGLNSTACSNFSTFMQQSSQDDELNFNSYFQQCFLDQSVSQKVATLSSFYFNKIYIPVYKKCLGF